MVLDIKLGKTSTSFGYNMFVTTQYFLRVAFFFRVRHNLFLGIGKTYYCGNTEYVVNDGQTYVYRWEEHNTNVLGETEGD